MGWFYDIDHPQAAQHEGYLALVLDDGTITAEYSARTSPRIVAWRFACDCGWMHPISPRASQPGPPPQALEAAARGEWEQHVRRDVPALHEAWTRARLPVMRDECGIPRPWPHEL